MFNSLPELNRLLMARLSRRIVFWVFVSLVAIEAAILIPSINRKQKELFKQIEEITSAKVIWIVTTYPDASPEELLSYVKQLQLDPMMQLIEGGAVCQADGKPIDSFGEKPEFSFTKSLAPKSVNLKIGARFRSEIDRYDVAWLIPHLNNNYILLIRHDSSGVRSEIYAFVLRIAGLVLIISVFVTLTTLIFLGSTVITPILRLRQDLLDAGEAIGRDKPAPNFYSASIERQDELGEVIAAFNRMFQQIWQAISDRKQAEAALAKANREIILLNDRLKEENLRMSAELEVARKLQQMLLPKKSELEQISDLEIAAFMEPATEVGGDYYDVLKNEKQVTIGIGDVTGHGLESGVLMLTLQTAIRTLQANQETDPVKFLNALNQTIYGNLQRMKCDKSLTLSLLDYQNGQVRLSGQHEEVLVFRIDGRIERIDTIDLGFPLGLESDIARFVAQTQTQLDRGDGIVLYTDGITEAQNCSGQQYGLERLCEVVRHNCHKSARQIQQIVVDDVLHHINGHKIYDDITLLVLKQK
jgi:serine phosphatase RsbU (regulator of sigma subunit)